MTRPLTYNEIDRREREIGIRMYKGGIVWGGEVLETK